METRDIEIFLTLAEELHFSRAAEKAAASPSAVSRVIQRLEQELGEQLFIRTKRSVELSAAGRAFLPRARAVLGQIQLAREELLPASGTLRGTLRLRATVTACYNLLPPLLEAFRDRFPFVEVLLRTDPGNEGIEAVLSGSADAAIVAVPSVPVPRLYFREIARSKLVLIGRADGRPFPGYSSAQFILPEQGWSRDQIDRWFADRFVHPRLYAQVNGNEAITALVRLGFGYGIVPELVLRNSPFLSGIDVVETGYELPELRIGIAVLESRKSSPLVRGFIGESGGLSE